MIAPNEDSPGRNGRHRAANVAPPVALEILPEERLRREIEDPDREAAFLKWLDDGLAGRGDRGQNANAGRLYAEARKLVGSQVELNVKITNMVGAPVSVARRAVEAMSMVEAMDEHDEARLAVRVLTEYCERHGLAVPSFPARLVAQVMP